MENFNIYEDLEELHAEEKKNAIEDLKWKEKYTVALETIQQLQADKKELNKKIKQLETNFASLLDTARTEIKRKDKQILELRKEKDDICFRRKKPQPDRHLSDTSKDVPSEGFRVNPFSQEPRKDIDTRRVVTKKFASASKEINDDNTKQWRTDQRQQTEKCIRENEQPRSRDYFDDRSRRRSRDHSERQSRNRSRDCLEDRGPSKNRYGEERSDHKNIDREEHPERNSRRDTSYSKDEKKRDERRDETQKTHSRDRLKTENSDRSWDKKKNCTNEKIKSQISEDQKPIKSDEPKNSINSKHTQNQQIEKKGHQKIEILQIEILKDAKELKKTKLAESKNENKNPEDPEKVATEKSNQFLDALFDDAAMTNNKVEEPNDLYDDLEAVKQSDSNNSAKMDENCNVKFQTPIKQPNEKLFEDLFGPSPSASVVAVVNRRNSLTSAGECSNDTVDFVRLPAKPMIPKPNEADNEKNTSPDSRSKDVIENKIVIQDSSSEKENNKNNATHEKSTKDITNNTATTSKEQTSFKFVELDSSFYSSEDDECTDRGVSASVNNPIIDIEPIETFEDVLVVHSENSFSSIESDFSNAIEKPMNGIGKMTDELKTCKKNSLPIQDEMTDKDKIARRNGTPNKCKMDDEKRKYIKKFESRKEEKRSRHSPSNKARSDAKEYNSRHRHISTKYDKRSPECDRKRKYDRRHRSKEHKSARSEKLYSVSKSSKSSRLKTMHDRKNIDSRKSVKDGFRSSPMLVWSDDNESPVKVPQRTQHSTNGLKEHQDQVIFLHCDDISDEEGDEFDVMDNQQQYNDSVPKTNDVNGESTVQDTLLIKSKAQVEQLNSEHESNKMSLEFVKVQELEAKQSSVENCQDVRNEEMKNCCEVVVLGEQNDANVTNINDPPAVRMEMLPCDDDFECEKSSEVAENFVEKFDRVVQNKEGELNSEVHSQASVCTQNATSEGKELIDEAKTDVPQASSNDKNNLTSCSLISQDQTQAEPVNGFIAVEIEERSTATEANKNVKGSSLEEPSNIEKFCSSDTGTKFGESFVDLNTCFDKIEAAVSLCDEIKTVHNDSVELQVLSAIQCETNTTHHSKEPCTVEEEDDSLCVDKNKVVILSNVEDSTVNEERNEELKEQIFNKNQNPNIKAMTDSSLPLIDMEFVNGGKSDKNESTSLKDDTDELVTNSSSENVRKYEMKDSDYLQDCESSLPNQPKNFTENGNEDDRAPEITTEEKISKEKILNEASDCKTFVKEKEVTMSCEILSTSDETEKLLIEENDLASSEVQSIVSNSDKASSSKEYRLETVALPSLISPQTLLKPINKPTSEDVSSGRRKKLKTPRKLPENVTSSSSTLVKIVENRRYSKSEEGRSFYSNEFVQLSMRRTQSSSNLSCLEDDDDKSKWDNLFRGNQPPKICSIEEAPIAHNTQQLEVDDQMTRLSEQKLEHVTEKEGKNSELRKLPDEKETENLKLLQVEDEVEETLTNVLGLECITKEGSEVSLEVTNGDRCLMLNSETPLLKEPNESIEKIILSEGAKDLKKQDCTTRIDAATGNVANRVDGEKIARKKGATLNCTEVKLHNDSKIENSTRLSTTDYKNIGLTENICYKSKSRSNSHFEEQGALQGSVVSLHEHMKLKDQTSNEEEIPPSPSNGTNGCQLKKFAKPKDTAISAERRKRKTGTTFPGFDYNHDTTISLKKDKRSPDSGNPKTKSKKKYKRIIQNCDSSGESDIFGDNVDHSLPTSTHYDVSKTGVNASGHSPDLKNLKKKQKTKQVIVPSAESSYSVISKLKSPTKLPVNPMETLSHVEEILDKIHSASFSTNVTAEDAVFSFTSVESSERCSEKTSETITDNSHSTDTSLNVSISTKIKKKSQKQKKRKLSECDETVAHSKRSRKQCLPETNLDNCQAKPSLSTEKENNQSPSHEKSLSAAVTPTHHKIFLNDVFPDNPPPVYNANEEDAQYQEIDDRLRSMFQSPTYTQASVGGECSFEQSNRNESSLNNSLTIAETLNQSNGSQCDSSTISRKVSLGSKDYVIETVGTHTANVFITRKKCKKRAKVAVAT